MSRLFTPFHIGKLALANRIVIAPMCQYSADEGSASDWHMIHLGHLALSGAGLLMLEASAVSADARISPADLGIYSDANAAAIARVVRAVRAYSPIAVAIQLAHAGRKASTEVPWQGGKQIGRGSPGGWQTLAPSPLPYAAGDEPPAALDRQGMELIRQHYALAARRAALIGLDGIEIHAAHGYLLHEFLSPLSNQRSDEYGGSLANRMRFPLEIYDVVRHAFPAERPVWMRISATDWVEGGWDMEGSLAFARALQARGCPLVHVSSGGLSPLQSIRPLPGYQVPFAARIKSEIGMPTVAVGLITEPEQAEAIIANDEADAVALARAVLYDPRWPWHAAAKLGARVCAPPQYWRSAPGPHKNLFITAAAAKR